MVFMIVYDWALIVLNCLYWQSSDPYIGIYKKIPLVKNTGELNCALLLLSAVLTFYKYYYSTKYRKDIKKAFQEMFYLFIVIVFFSVPYNMSYKIGEAGKPFLEAGHYQIMKMAMCGMVLYCGLKSSYAITGGWREEETGKKSKN